MLGIMLKGKFDVVKTACEGCASLFPEEELNWEGLCDECGEEEEDLNANS